MPFTPSTVLRAKLVDSRRDLLIALTVCLGGPLGLYLDSDASLLLQNALGVVAWVVLFLLLRGESGHVRMQVVVVIAVATLVEHFCAPHSHVYIYRFDNVPAYVPPAHGMVYLTAAALGRSAIFHHLRQPILWLTLLSGVAWALWGAWFAERQDLGGAALFALFLFFLLRGSNPLLYAAAFFITTYLELVGTHYGTWAWAVYMPDFALPQANPPSGIAAGYCLFDAAAVNGAAYMEGHRHSLWFRCGSSALSGIMDRVLIPILLMERLLYRASRALLPLQ